MRISVYELASQSQRIEAEGRDLVLEYWLVRESIEDGLATHYVRCYQRELRHDRLLSAAAEVAGLGEDGATARRIYDRLVRGAAMPVHLQDIVREAREQVEACRRDGGRDGSQDGQEGTMLDS